MGYHFELEHAVKRSAKLSSIEIIKGQVQNFKS